MTLSIHWANEALQLLPERALYWPRAATLFVADLHMGKDATFRAAGIGLPPGNADKDLARLDAALARTQAQRLVILGDFLHAKTGRSAGTLATIGAWRARNAALQIVLVRGNHDRHAGEPLTEWQIQSVGDEWYESPFYCRHEPLAPPACANYDPAQGYILAGHLHPMMNLPEGMRLPCFLFGAKQALLPAFSSFTGGIGVRPKAGEQAFVITPSEVLRVR